MRYLFLLISLLGLLATPSATAREEALDYTVFAQIPIQHEGRIKPLDTFARAMLGTFSGHQSLDGLAADAWLAETLFDPAQAMTRPVFRILKPELLGLASRARKYYSFAEIAPALQRKADVLAALSQTEEKNWNGDQRELMRLSENMLLYTQLLRSFSFLLPLNLHPPASLAKEWKIDAKAPLTLQEYGAFENRLKNRLQKIITAKGEDINAYSDEERDIARFAMDMDILAQAGTGNVLLRILPGVDGERVWFSPWNLRESGQGSPESATYLGLWQTMARAYLLQDAQKWENATRAAKDHIAAESKSGNILLEIAYNKLHPLNWAMGFYLLSCLLLVAHFLRGRAGLRIAALTALGAGAFLNGAAIVARVVLLSRPPVGTLYESILFVAFVCAAAAIVFEMLRKDGNGILLGGLCGLLLLFVARSFADDDTMKMLTAVLNTNFWLATHVLCITMGYGWCLLVSVLAHVWLVRTAIGRDAAPLVRPVKVLALIALLFTAVGTILGGIWADQSWGRFWGWDPKENGALLIVLWIIWVLHGQIGGGLKRQAAMAAYAALAVIVALAWFGVNLLSVGLHSYGFVTGVAAGLAAFCALELGTIGALWWLGAQRKPAAP